jgi:hypothetical protein
VALKVWVRAELGTLVDELAQAEPVEEPLVLADRLMLVLEGMYATGPSGARAGRGAAARCPTRCSERNQRIISQKA